LKKNAALEERIDQMRHDIYKIAQVILLGAVRDQIELYGSWGVWADRVSSSQFCPEVAAKHEIQVRNVEMHDNIEVDFEMLGSLADVFKKHKFSPTMHATVQNSGNEWLDFKCEADLDDIDSPSVPIYAKPSQDHFERLSGLHEDLGKKYLFALMSQ